MGARIKERLDELDRNVKWLSSSTRIPASTLYELINGGQKSSSKTGTIAHALGLRAHWLETGIGRREEQEQPGNANLHLAEPRGAYKAPSGAKGGAVRQVPLISWVAAGSCVDVADPYVVGDSDQMVLAFGVSERSFALRVRGPSMEPEFRDGAIIIVDPTLEARTGDYVVVRLNAQNQATFKQLFIEGEERWLRPLNPQFPAILITVDAVICGVVKQQTREY